MIDVGGLSRFACDECPIVEQLERRMALAKEYPEYGPFQYNYCSCNKVDDEFHRGGYCEDAWVKATPSPKAGCRRTGRAYRRQMATQKLQVAKGIVRGYSSPAMDMEPTKAHVIQPQNSHRKGFYKNYSNRVIRRKKAVFPKGNQSHKLFDFGGHCTKKRKFVVTP